VCLVYVATASVQRLTVIFIFGNIVRRPRVQLRRRRKVDGAVTVLRTNYHARRPSNQKLARGGAAAVACSKLHSSSGTDDVASNVEERGCEYRNSRGLGRVPVRGNASRQAMHAALARAVVHYLLIKILNKPTTYRSPLEQA